jgi:hypothetical protein
MSDVESTVVQNKIKTIYKTANNADKIRQLSKIQ